MKKLLLVLALIVSLAPFAQARNSAATYDNKYYSQQEWVQGFNNSTATIYRDFIVGLDTTAGVNPNVNLGQYVTEQTSSTTDNIFVFGVADETILPGQLGRIAIRGPHKVVVKTQGGVPSFSITAGTLISQCSNNVPQVFNGTSIINGGIGCAYSTATGTAGGMVGIVLNSTATTDNGDVGQTTNAQNFTTGAEYWTWIAPQVNR